MSDTPPNKHRQNHPGLDAQSATLLWALCILILSGKGIIDEHPDH